MADPTIANGPFLGSSRNPFSYEKVEQISRDVQTSWLTLDEVTQQLNLFQDDSQADYLYGLELATRMAIEDYLGMPIFPIQWKAYYGSNGATGTAITLDLPEVSQDDVEQGTKGVTIDEVGFWSYGVQPTYNVLNPDQYAYDPSGNKVIVNGIPNMVSQIITNPISVIYTTQASPIAQYPVIKLAALLLLTHLYNNRSNTVQGSLNQIPFGVDTLLRPYKPLVM